METMHEKGTLRVACAAIESVVGIFPRSFLTYRKVNNQRINLEKESIIRNINYLIQDNEQLYIRRYRFINSGKIFEMVSDLIERDIVRFKNECLAKIDFEFTKAQELLKKQRHYYQVGILK